MENTIYGMLNFFKILIITHIINSNFFAFTFSPLEAELKSPIFVEEFFFFNKPGLFEIVFLSKLAKKARIKLNSFGLGLVIQTCLCESDVFTPTKRVCPNESNSLRLRKNTDSHK